jgi:hypothetical protein
LAAIKRRVLFNRYFSSQRFAQSLAVLPLGTWPRTGEQQVAAYRLGLYDTVANSAWDGEHLPGGVAVAVSLAACGQAEAAQALAQRLLAVHGRGAWVAGLADALAPFAPGLALSLLDDAAGQSVLGTSLLLRTGQQPAAAHAVRAALAQGRAQSEPEWWLCATNALGGDAAEQLQRLNAYLAAFDLPPLQLRQPALPPAAGNLRGAGALPVVNGPLVSVIMTAYNAAQRIGPALDGLLSQTWRNLEVLVVDDASTDGTADVVQRVAQADARVRAVLLPCNVGTYVAKTVGLELARGGFVTCHDSDDWSHPLRIERQMLPLLKDSRLVATTSQWVRIQDDGVFYARPVHPLARMNPASPLFRKQAVLQRTGAWDAVRTGADSEFQTRLRLVFGRRAVRRLALPLTLGAHHAASLMNAAATGYSSQGLSAMPSILGLRGLTRPIQRRPFRPRIRLSG